MQLSILIVNYNAKYFAEHCLLSVKKACVGTEAEVLLWDNKSTDGSREYLEPKFPGIKFFRSAENLGFGKANNQLLEHATGEYILFLNPDTIVPEDCFTDCINFFKQHSDCGALGVRMIDGSGKFLPESKRGFPGASASFYKMFGFAKMFRTSKTFAAYYAGHLPENETNKTDVLAGAFMMISREAIKKVKGFDENFFMYGEDIDLSYRIKEAGFFNYYFPVTTIIHFKGESTQKGSPAYHQHFYGAMKLFAAKHYSGFRKIMINAGISIGRMLNTVKTNVRLQHTKAELPAQILLAAAVSADNGEAKKICIGNNIRVNEFSDNISMQTLPAEKEICLCEGAISNKTIIEFLQQKKNSTNIYFHESGAASIISSGNKNKNGIFIAAS